MNNKSLLIIGNGFDLKLGLKTRYNDFLDSIDEYKDMDLKTPNITVSNYVPDKKMFVALNDYTYPKAKNLCDLSTFQISHLRTLYEISKSKNDMMLFYYQKNTGTIEYENFSLSPLGSLFENANTIEELLKISNFWLLYFKINSVNSGKNWLDLENILRDALELDLTNDKNIIKNPKHTNIHIFLERFYNDIEQSGYSNGNLFFQLLEKMKDYISSEEKRVLNLNNENTIKINTLTKDSLSEILNSKDNDIINFNYTKKLFQKYLGSKNTYHIHGTTESNIVFGSNSFNKNNEKFNVSDFSYLIKERQILEYDKRSSFKLNRYENLVIIGHSCGVNDYDYFFHIFDENPNINIYLCWYDYEQDGVLYNTKNSITNNFYQLIYAYEVKRNIQKLTPMHINNKIHRVKVDIFWK